MDTVSTISVRESSAWRKSSQTKDQRTFSVESSSKESSEESVSKEHYDEQRDESSKANLEKDLFEVNDEPDQEREASSPDADLDNTKQTYGCGLELIFPGGETPECGDAAYSMRCSMKDNLSTIQDFPVAAAHDHQPFSLLTFSSESDGDPLDIETAMLPDFCQLGRKQDLNKAVFEDTTDKIFKKESDDMDIDASGVEESNKMGLQLAIANSDLLAIAKKTQKMTSGKSSKKSSGKSSTKKSSKKSSGKKGSSSTLVRSELFTIAEDIEEEDIEEEDIEEEDIEEEDIEEEDIEEEEEETPEAVPKKVSSNKFDDIYPNYQVPYGNMKQDLIEEDTCENTQVEDVSDLVLSEQDQRDDSNVASLNSEEFSTTPPTPGLSSVAENTQEETQEGTHIIQQQQIHETLESSDSSDSSGSYEDDEKIFDDIDKYLAHLQNAYLNPKRNHSPYEVEGSTESKQDDKTSSNDFTFSGHLINKVEENKESKQDDSPLNIDLETKENHPSEVDSPIDENEGKLKVVEEDARLGITTGAETPKEVSFLSRFWSTA